jgi:polysaccharide biosynthesis protein PelA
VRRVSLAILGLVACALSAPDASARIRWAAYYSDGAPLHAFEDFSVLVFDSDAHPPLPPLDSQGKVLLGYLSVGEVANYRSYYAAVRAQGLLVGENSNWKGSFFVDVRDPRWARRVLDEIIPQILQRGFAGVFLDTLDNAAHLERTNPRAYRGMSAAAANLVATIRARYPRIKIMLNRAYDLLPSVDRHIDYALGESVHADYDFETKRYQLVPRALYEQQVRILQSARQRRPQLQVFTLDYWDPADPAGVARIYAEQRKNGFHPYVATVALDRVVPEPAP